MQSDYATVAEGERHATNHSKINILNRGVAKVARRKQLCVVFGEAKPPKARSE
jgi:hypothetical protein